jgi:hypothetical protein
MQTPPPQQADRWRNDGNEALLDRDKQIKQSFIFENFKQKLQKTCTKNWT